MSTERIITKNTVGRIVFIKVQQHINLIMEEEDHFDAVREKLLEENVLEHFDVLIEKTVNFEDLVNELFGKGYLSLDEKFKVLSGAVEEKSSKKKASSALQDKCEELYSTLKRKQIAWSKILKCWEETGNDYLFGRFDTHFMLEGRDSKSHKFTKFKLLPHNRTEFLTHLYLKKVQIAPHSLIKCLRKSNRVESIILENIKIPHGGRDGDDPASEFDQTIILPKLREFYLVEVFQEDQQKPFKSLKEIANYLDELNLKAMMFFAVSIDTVFQSKVSVEIRLRRATILKMIFNEGTNSEMEGIQFVSMLRRRPEIFGGLVCQDKWREIHLYESFVPRGSLSESLTHLNLYRCRVANYNPYVSSCAHLVELHLYSEFDYEESKIVELDMNALNLSKNTLRNISLGFIHLTNSQCNVDKIIELSLESLCLTCCLLDRENLNDFYELFQNQKRLFWRCGSPHPSSSFLQAVLTTMVTNEVAVSHFQWDEEDTNTETVKEFLKSSGPPSIIGDERAFVFQRNTDPASGKSQWIANSIEETEFDFFTFQHSGWGVFCNDAKSWFHLPLTLPKGGDDSNSPRNIFCKVKNCSSDS